MAASHHFDNLRPFYLFRFLCLDGPAHFGRPGTGILETLLGGGSDDILAHLAVNALPLVLFEGLFDQTIFSGVEGEHCYPAASFQHLG